MYQYFVKVVPTVYKKLNGVVSLIVYPLDIFHLISYFSCYLAGFYLSTHFRDFSK